MKKIIAIQSNKLNEINIETDTTFLLALEAQKKGYQIIWYETKDLNLINSKIYINGIKVRFFDRKKNFYKILSFVKFNLDEAKFVLIRQNPPFNMDYINSTHFLNNLKSTRIINDPTAVRNVSEKFFSTRFLKYMPETIITKNIKQIISFKKKHKKIVIKPIHGYAGKKDKRVFIINGKVKGAIRRLPKKGSILSNISQGGVAIKTKLNLRELKISKLVAKSLKKENIFFAGIDLVGGYLIGDINVTSPTGLPQYRNLTNINLAQFFWKEVEKLK